MARERRHHLVSRGFQRAWTADGKRLLLVDIKERTGKLVGTRHAFCVPNVLTIQTQVGPNTDVEKAFGQVESLHMPHLRRFADQGDRDGEAEAAVRAILALHWARSESLLQLMQRILQQGFESFVEGLEGDKRLANAFDVDYQRAPEPGEIRGELRRSADALIWANAFFAWRVVDHYNRAGEHFSKLHSQRITMTRPARVDFVFADSPVVMKAGRRGTAREVVALMEADTLWCPLSPDVGVMLTTTPEDDYEIRPIPAQQLNQLSLGYAQRYLGAHPRTDLDRALQKQPGTYRIHRGSPR